MAGSSMKDIKSRIRSVESTRQITKAMEMVASSKLRRAKERAERSRPYFDVLHAALADIAEGTENFSSPFVQQRTPVRRSCFVVIAGDRGLAGGYNSNVFKMAAEAMQGKSCCVVPIGRRSAEYFARRRADIYTQEYARIEELTVGACSELGDLLARAYLAGEFDELYVVYTNFVSMLSQQPAVLRLLPLNAPPAAAGGQAQRHTVLYEPGPEAVYNAIVPDYLAGIVWCAVCESFASELGARRTAMDSASKNADAMISDLSLHYNRARQAAITQEITEIVAGAGG